MWSEPKVVTGSNLTTNWKIVDVRNRRLNQVERHIMPIVVDESGKELGYHAEHDWTERCKCGPEIKRMANGIVKVGHRDLQPVQ